MNIRDLNYFYYLSLYHSFTEVAQHFQVSQPTITYAIKRLEEEFGCQLVVKTPAKRVAHLTRQGELLANHAQEILLELDKAKKAIEHANQGKTRLGFPPMISMDIFSKIVQQFLDLDLYNAVDFVREGSHDLLEELLDGKVDMSLIGSLTSLWHEKLITKELFQKEFYLVMSEQHPLATFKELSFSQVLKEKFIILDEHHIHLTAFNQLNAKYQGRAQIALMLEDFLMIGQMVRENIGITLITDIALMKSIDGLVKVPLIPEEKLFFHVSYAYLKTAVPSELTKRFINALEELKDSTDLF